jgi:hypothetical protein
LFLTSAQGVIRAQPVCMTDTLQAYINLADGCTIDGFQFFSFTFSGMANSGSPPVASAANIDVTPEPSPSGPTISFSSSPTYFSLTGAESVTYQIDYGIDPGPVIGGERLSIDPPFGGVSITQDYFPNTPPGCGDCPFFPLTVTPANPTASVTFPAPTSQVAVTTDISISSTPAEPAGFDSFANATDITNNAATPEPSAGALFTAGCAVLLGFCWSRRCLPRKERGRVEGRVAEPPLVNLSKVGL